MFKPCPNCGFLVALIAGREASQRCPRCGSALVTEAEALDLAAEDARARPGRDSGAAAREALPQVGDRGDMQTPRTPAPPANREPARIAPVADATGALHARPLEAATDAMGVDADVAPTTTRDTDAVPDATPVSETTASAPAPETTQPDATPAHDGPSFVRRGRGTARPAGRRWPWYAALAGLALLLAVQLLFAQRTELARDAGWRPLVVRACGLVGCDVPPWHAPREYAMLARGVRPDPARAGVLHVTATVRNDARWPQPPPTVVLSLSDIDGRLVGARSVAPPDYGRRVDALVAPGDSLDIAFDVREPAGHVESFDFQLQ